MSYARFGEKCADGRGSDVYVYATQDGRVICTSDTCTFATRSNQEMLDHLQAHLRNGDAVPERAIDRLGFELASRTSR